MRGPGFESQGPTKVESDHSVLLMYVLLVIVHFLVAYGKKQQFGSQLPWVQPNNRPQSSHLGCHAAFCFGLTFVTSSHKPPNKAKWVGGHLWGSRLQIGVAVGGMFVAGF
jgi:hypothetical protein